MSERAHSVDEQQARPGGASATAGAVGLPDNKLSTTAFRFVSVRGPRNPTMESLGLGFISYASIGPPSPLFTSLASIGRDGELTAGQRLSAVKSAANSFKTTAAFFSDLGQLYAVAPRLWDFGQWLTARASSVTTAMVRDHLPESAAMRLREEDTSGLWDNLFAHLVSGGGTDLRQHLIESLRADHFLRHSHMGGAIAEEAVLRRLAAARLLLPREIFPLPRPDAPGSQSSLGPDLAGSREAEPADVDGPDLPRRIEQVRETLGHLRGAYARQLERAVARQAETRSAGGTPPAAPTAGGEAGTDVGLPPQAAALLPSGRLREQPAGESVETGLLTLDLLASLPDTAKGVLTQYGITPGQRVTFAFDTLTAAESTLTTAAWGQVSLTRPLYTIGGGLWIEDYAAIPSVVNGNGGPPAGGLLDPSICPNPLLGVADLRRVEQELCCYLPGEIAHIENILAGEHKDRTTRRLRRSEETFAFSAERETVDERDTQTTDRFELQREIAKTITEQTSFEAGLTTSGQFGPVHVEASLGYSTSSASTESDKQALAIAQSVTDKALQRVTEKVREERIAKVLEEFEETNRHELDNRGAGSAPVVGLYRWVDKLYKARVVNYGKRLTLDFMIPEPGAFHLWAMTKPAASAGVTLEEPLDPRSASITALFGQAVTPLRKHTDVTATNYGLWAAAYGATVEPPPPEWRIFSAKLGEVVAQKPATPGGQLAMMQPKDEIALDPGYAAKVARIQLHFDIWRPEGGWVNAMVGRSVLAHPGPWPHFVGSLALNDETGLVPISLLGFSTYLAAHIEIEAQLTAAGKEAWQLKTFKAIMDAYMARKAAYENALAEAKAQRGVDIQGTNPLLNRVIERNELKKSCISWLHRGHSFSTDGIVPAGNDDCHPPKIKTDCATWEGGSRALFMEQAFEWTLMTYLFYPYYWASQCRWRQLYRLDNADPLFQSFLQAGTARVTVPVRPGFESAVLYFLSSGQIWNGADAPAFSDPLNLSITDELAQPVGEVEGDPWDIRVPTALTVLQCAAGCVEGNGLPCGTASGFGAGTGGRLAGIPTAPH